jgi:hypothetical protein
MAKQHRENSTTQQDEPHTQGPVKPGETANLLDATHPEPLRQEGCEALPAQARECAVLPWAQQEDAPGEYARGTGA